MAHSFVTGLGRKLRRLYNTAAAEALVPGNPLVFPEPKRGIECCTES